MLRIYNTLSKQVEEFKAVNPPEVRMYVCGPTVYDYSHIGHARTYIVFDTFRKFLTYIGYNVKYVQNITDVDDKIINRANKEGMNPKELSEKFTREYFYDMKSLGIEIADIQPKVTEHIQDIIEIVKTLIDKGFAYNVSGDVYFDVTKFSGYGKLSGQTLEDIKAGARVAIDERKRNPADFALWKKAKPNEPFWDSPWGKGRPGWHIECSAMSMRYLEVPFDIHGGGQDLVFPHHENEIAQSEAYSGKPFANYWMHVGFLTVDGEKMSKSLGNFITIRDMLKKYKKEAVRLLMLSTHYRSPLDFTWDKIEQSDKSFRRLMNTIIKTNQILKEYDEIYPPHRLDDEALQDLNNVIMYENQFLKALNDDFNTPAALAALFNLVKFTNNYLERDKNNPALLLRIYGSLTDFASLFGILDETVLKKETVEMEELDRFIELLVSVRQKARSKKDWELADYIREELKKLGIRIEDTKTGTKWMYLGQ